MTRFDQTVHATSGRAAASCRVTPGGTGSTWARGHDHRLGITAARQQGTNLLPHNPFRYAVADGGNLLRPSRPRMSLAPGGGG